MIASCLFLPLFLHFSNIPIFRDQPGTSDALSIIKEFKFHGTVSNRFVQFPHALSPASLANRLAVHFSLVTPGV